MLYFVRVVKFRHLICSAIVIESKLEKIDIELEIEDSTTTSTETETANTTGDKNNGGYTVTHSTAVQDILQCIPRLRYCYALTFDYLEHIHESIRPGIIKFDSSAINNIASSIYKQCLVVDSVDEVNISYECRENIKTFFSNNGDAGKEITDYLTIFDDSMIEIYSLLNSAYRFKFISS